MNFKNVRRVYVFSCIVLCLIFLSPTLAMIVPFPEGERFSELWILGPTHMMENYPFNVSPRVNYHVFLGVGNQMGHFEYYSIRVKLRNQSDPSPDSGDGLPSSLEPIFEYRVFLINNGTWEREFSFSFEDVFFEGDVSRVSRISISGYHVNMSKVAAWDDANSGFYYQLFFELWIYNATVSSFQFHNRYVGFWLNVTKPL
jgi:hypothetical protein